MTSLRELTDDDLIELARGRSRDSRRALFHNIAELFVDDDARLTDRERALMTGILNSLIGEVERDVRMALADRLKGRSDAPRDLIVLLANDEIAVAGNVLRESLVLEDPDLIGIIRDRGREHALAVSARSSVSADVSDALLDTGDEDVIEALLRNPNAALSAAATVYLVAEAERLDRYQAPLLRRPDLPPALAMRLYWWVSAALRRYILTRFDISKTTVDTEVEQAVLAVAGQTLNGHRSLDDISGDLIDRLAATGPISPKTLIDLLRTGRVAAFLSGLAHYATTPLTLVRRVVLEADGESLAVICRGREVNRNDFATLYLLVRTVSRRQEPLPPQQLQELLEFYDAMAVDRAQSALAYWSLNPDYLAAIAAVDRDLPRDAWGSTGMMDRAEPANDTNLVISRPGSWAGRGQAVGPAVGQPADRRRKHPPAPGDLHRRRPAALCQCRASPGSRPQRRRCRSAVFGGAAGLDGQQPAADPPR